MAFAPQTLADLLPGAHPFDEIIDVRAPSEFAEDHIPGALSLPVLDDDERARVGTIYTRESPFLARKIGAALVARNAARHLEEVLADRPGGWQPLLYCWRGGQRSNAFASILAQIGWRVQVIEGGYRHYRKLVRLALEAPPICPVVLLDGNTGTAKTALLPLLDAEGVQSIDLEGLAGHRGSTFGETGGQPSQKMFESRLAMALASLRPDRVLVLEAESHRIGKLRLPPGLWRAMQAAPRVEVQAPLAARADFLTEVYADITEDPLRLATMIDRLRPLHPARQIEAWQTMATTGAHRDLAESLMVAHYDPAYLRLRGRHGGATATLWTEGLQAPHLRALAGRVAAAAIGLAAAAPSA